MDLFIYLAKASFLLTLFWVIYKVFLEAETYHRWKRIYLHLGYLLSLLLPLLTYTKIKEISSNPSFILPSSSEVFSAEVEPSQMSSAWSFIWDNGFVEILYLLISLVFFINLVMKFWKLLRFLKRSQSYQVDGVFHLQTPTSKGAFSFLNYVVYDPKCYSEEELNTILIHENAHIKCKHSWDILFSHLYTCVFWCNPFAWLYQKSLVLNLEYEADAQVAYKIPKKDYQLTLYNITQQQFQSQLQHSFHQSPIKKRIVMLNKNQTQASFWKLFIITPLLIVFFLFFQVETKAQAKESTVDTITVHSRFEFQSNDTVDKASALNYEKLKTTQHFVINGTEFNKSKLANTFIPVDTYSFSEETQTLSIQTLQDFSQSVYDDIRDMAPFLTDKFRRNFTKELLFINVTKDYKPVLVTLKDFKMSKSTEEELLNKTISRSNTSSQPQSKFLNFETELQNSSSAFSIDGLKASREDVLKLKPEKMASISVIKGKENVQAEGYDSESVDTVIKIFTKDNQIDASQPNKKSRVSTMQIRTQQNVKYIKEGKEIEQDELNQLNPNQIKSIKVLKTPEEIKEKGFDPKEIEGVVDVTTKDDAFVSKYLEENTKLSMKTNSNDNLIYLVDGVEVEYDAFKELDPENLKTLEVIKFSLDIENEGYDPKQVDGILKIKLKE